MDMFILRNHYGYVDQKDITTGGEKLPASQVAPIVQIIERD
jgi:hypothetical protein